MVQLMNCGGEHHDTEVLLEDSIPSVKNISLSIVLPKKPRAIWQQPENVKLDFTWHDGRADRSGGRANRSGGRAEVHIPELAIHSTLVVK